MIKGRECHLRHEGKGVSESAAEAWDCYGKQQINAQHPRKDLLGFLELFLFATSEWSCKARTRTGAFPITDASLVLETRPRALYIDHRRSLNADSVRCWQNTTVYVIVLRWKYTCSCHVMIETQHSHLVHFSRISKFKIKDLKKGHINSKKIKKIIKWLLIPETPSCWKLWDKLDMSCKKQNFQIFLPLAECNSKNILSPNYSQKPHLQ